VRHTETGYSVLFPLYPHQYHDDIRVHRSLWAQGSVPRELLSSAQVQCKQLQATATEHAAAITVSTQAAAAAAQDAQREDAHRRLTRAAEAGLVGTLLRSAAAELFAASQEAAELRIAFADSVPRPSDEFERRVRTLPIPAQQ
jgi:hypothetical protein